MCTASIDKRIGFSRTVSAYLGLYQIPFTVFLKGFEPTKITK